jgi:hypothetical protein
VVRDIGHGSLKKGERVLDLFVRKVRDSATAFFFLRQPSRPNPTRPEAKSGRVAGSGAAWALE